MPFEVPEETSKPDLSKNTVKIYKSKLNKLAEAGFTDTTALTLQPKAVCDEIVRLEPDGVSMNGRMRRRLYISSIFWVLPEQFRASKNAYYELFQGVKDEPPPS
jgi:hypothetical protein